MSTKEVQAVILLTEMVKLVKFHELQDIDTKAAELLERAAVWADGGDVDDFIEEVRVANLCSMST
ncbi:MAG: hypothetical protein V3S69_00865 [Dehalococcoidales bacterium]